ncbi:right-handed parallel beta-helix repeat-containing protein [Treponema sp. OMZ 906]|uniref:right-handed parallel beta-helix repeat-containing protein n=1 Tax=Treponema sp. OMZ 906 TaxID=2563662 RepID=UPI0020A4359A|nr:right-handed parallel beta-helix repeat-containing protein [Treponema sp. OMZ 906]UTC56188.1 right-handed parallel beta-helix repeat-containing protein [Treponema sp. OMZ 906]
MRKFITFITVISFSLIFACCQPYAADIEEFLSYWSSEAAVTGFKIDSEHYINDVGVACLPSDRDATVILTVRNPKKFKFVTPTTVLDAAAVIRFPGLPSQPVPRTDYTLRQSAPDTLELRYKSSFLKKYEWGTADIGPVITLKSDDGRPFTQTFKTNIMVNTLPPGITKITIAKSTDPTPCYVVCCEIDGTNILDPVNSGDKLHGDIVALRVTKDGETEKTIPIRVNGTGFDITHSGGELLSRTNVTELFSDSSYTVPSGQWVVYLKTNIQPYDPAAALPHTYRIRLADTKNLMSDAKETHTLEYSVDTSGSSEAWKKVRKAVTDVAAGGVITLSGTINATNAPGNRGQIEISKNLTIQGAPGNSPAVLDAHHLGLLSSTSIANSHRIFTVKGAVDVTLQNLTLKRGKDAVAANIVGSGGGGIWASANANLTLINVTVEDCISKAPGGGIRYDHGTGNKRLTMINCRIKNNTVQDDGGIADSSGGGISLPWCLYTAVIDGCTIAGNKIDMSAKTGSAPRLEAEGCGLACSATSSSITIIKGHTVIENNQCIPHALKPCECKGMGIFCGSGPLTIGETGKDNNESPEILNHGNPIPTNVTVAGTALYIKKKGTVRWLRGKIHDNGTDPNNSIKNAGGTLSNRSETSPS